MVLKHEHLKKKPNPENEHACLLLMLWYKYTRLLNLFPFTISANCKNWDSYIYVFTLYYYILLCVHCIYEQKTQIMICIYMYSCIILNTNVCLFHRFVFSFLDRKISFFFFWWTPNIEKKLGMAKLNTHFQHGNKLEWDIENSKRIFRKQFNFKSKE